LSRLYPDVHIDVPDEKSAGERRAHPRAA